LGKLARQFAVQMFRKRFGEFPGSLFRIARLLLRMNVRRAERQAKNSRKKKYKSSHRIASENFPQKK
jgi:hypothetical protein